MSVVHVPGDFAELTDALEQCSDGTIIELHADVYRGSHTISKPVVIRGSEGTLLAPCEGDGSPIFEIEEGSLCLQDVKLIESVAAIVAYGSARLDAVRCAFVRNGTGILAWGDAQVRTCESVFSESTDAAIRASELSHLDLEQSLIHRGDIGIELRDQASLLMKDSRIQQNGSGICATDSATLRCEQCTISDNCRKSEIPKREDLTALLLRQWNVRVTPEEVKRSDRLLRRGESLPSAGVVLQGEASGVLVRTEISKQCTGVLVSGGQAELEGCTIRGNRSPGMVVSDAVRCVGGGRVRIDGSTVSDNDNGISVSARSGTSEVAVTETQFCHNKLALSAGPGGAARVSHSQFRENAQACIADEAVIEISDNSFEQNTDSIVARFSTVTGASNHIEGYGPPIRGDVHGDLRAGHSKSGPSELRFPNPTCLSLQEAIDAVEDGGTILLQAGTYETAVSISKRLTLSVEGGAGRAVLVPPPGWFTRPNHKALYGATIGIHPMSPDSPVLVSIGPGAEVQWNRIDFCGSVECNGNAQSRFASCNFYGVGRESVGLLAFDQCSIVLEKYCRTLHCSLGTLIADDSKLTASHCTWELCGYGGGIAVVGQATAELERNAFRNCANSVVGGCCRGDHPHISGQDNEFDSPVTPKIHGYVPDLRKTQEPTQERVTLPDDRYATINEAIDDLKPGGILVLGAGQHTGLGHMLIGKPVRIRGDRQTSVVGGAVPWIVNGGILTVNAVTFARRVVVRGEGQVRMEDCHLRDGIHVGDSAIAEMSGCEIACADNKKCVDMEGPATITIQGCSLHGGSSGLWANDGACVEIADSSLFDLKYRSRSGFRLGRQYAVYLGLRTSMRMARCQLYDNDEVGICALGMTQLHMEDTQVRGHQTGLELGSWKGGHPPFALSGHGNIIQGNKYNVTPDPSGTAKWPDGFLDDEAN